MCVCTCVCVCVSQWLHIHCGDSPMWLLQKSPLPPTHPHTRVVHISIGTGGGQRGHDPPEFERGPNGMWPPSGCCTWKRFVLGRGLSECWLSCVLCLCVWLLGLFLFNSVPMWTQMCLCVLSPCLFVRLLVALVLCRVGLLVMFPVQVGMVWPLLRLLHTLPPLAVGTP